MAFYHVLSQSFSLIWQWGWLILPFAAFHIAWQIWVLYREFIVAHEIYKGMVFLRIHLPREIESTPKSMDQVFHNIHGILGHIRSWEKFVWREHQPWFSFELVGMNGNLYFIVAVEKKRKSTIITALQSEYPDIEIEEVADYTLSVPLDIPNKDWNVHGYEFTLVNEDIWRIKTFEDWELEKEIEAGRKLDPIAQWAEVCSDLKPGEHLWLQIVMSPIASNENNWFDKAAGVRRGFDKPQEKEEPIMEQVTGGIEDFFRAIAGRPLASELKEKEFSRLRFPSTLDVLIVKVLGSKMERPIFEVNVRGIYLAQHELFSSSRRASLRGFVRPFADYTNNYFRAQDKTETRITRFLHFFPQTRINIKRRRALWYYRMRYLRREEPIRGQFGFSEKNLLYRLNTQELATIFHFPGREASAPGLRRLPFKKSKAPVDLPTI